MGPPGEPRGSCDAGSLKMRPPFSPAHLRLFLFALGCLRAFAQMALLTIPSDKLGLPAGSAFLLLFTAAIGSAVSLRVLVAPITAAVVAVMVEPAHGAPPAYICGTL
ncbi:MAG TPA: hypothetical protein PLO69_07750 [Gammaproteobacteria bacterium]|nr:hypothetical protein [Gammaproteobacteria bacterium]